MGDWKNDRAEGEMRKAGEEIMKKAREKSKEKSFPSKDGWYWVLIDGYDKPTPCWFMLQSNCFLPGGMGDSSSMGLYESDIKKVGPEIIEPNF